MKIGTPLNEDIVKKLKAGMRLSIWGTIYTARDKAHKRLVELIKQKKPLPFELRGSIIYYCGPTPAKPGEIIGSCGPTTSSRMDTYSPILYKQGVKATIGKGERNEEVIRAIKKYKGLYFITWGGCGAYLREFVKSCRAIAFEDLGAEAIYELEVEDFPVIVAIDSKGNSIFLPK